MSILRDPTWQHEEPKKKTQAPHHMLGFIIDHLNIHQKFWQKTTTLENHQHSAVLVVRASTATMAGEDGYAQACRAIEASLPGARRAGVAALAGMVSTAEAGSTLHANAVSRLLGLLTSMSPDVVEAAASSECQRQRWCRVLCLYCIGVMWCSGHTLCFMLLRARVCVWCVCGVCVVCVRVSALCVLHSCSCSFVVVVARRSKPDLVRLATLPARHPDLQPTALAQAFVSAMGTLCTSSPRCLPLLCAPLLRLVCTLAVPPFEGRTSVLRKLLLAGGSGVWPCLVAQLPRVLATAAVQSPTALRHAWSAVKSLFARVMWEATNAGALESACAWSPPSPLFSCCFSSFLLVFSASFSWCSVLFCPVLSCPFFCFLPAAWITLCAATHCPLCFPSPREQTPPMPHFGRSKRKMSSTVPWSLWRVPEAPPNWRVCKQSSHCCCCSPPWCHCPHPVLLAHQ